MSSLDSCVDAAVRAVAGWLDRPLAIVLGGSHAAGEAVWVPVGATRVSLSDIDLHAIVAGPVERRAAEARAVTELPKLTASLRDRGLAAPVELGVHTEADWRALPARPATLELRARGQVVAGDPGCLERLPAWRATDVPQEEILLLLENRAFELIAARWESRPGDPLAALAAAHARYKVAMDLAAVERLLEGAFEDDATSRVRAARAARAARRSNVPEPAWEGALAFRRGAVPSDAQLAADADRIEAAWVLAWSSIAAPDDPGERFETVARVAASRARLRRRLRMAAAPEIPAGLAPPLGSRVQHALAGTPQHRLNASAGAFLAAQVLARRAPAAAAEARTRLARVLTELGVVPPGDDREVAVALLETWRRWVLGGTRGVTAS